MHIQARRHASPQACKARTGELSGMRPAQVWRSYGEMHRRGIGAIPLFVFNLPEAGLVGGPLRDGPGTPYTITGSHTAEDFYHVFEVWNRHSDRQ